MNLISKIIDTILSYEQNFDPHQFRALMEKYSFSTGLGIVLGYLLSIGMLKNYMESRPAFNLRWPLIFWSLLCCVFSLAGAYRCVPAFIEIIRKGGFYASVCSNEFYTGKPEAFWTAAFMLYKFPELIDTYFIILRKRKLIFLHWYHHATVLAYGWLTFHWWYAGPGWYGSMNFSVHFIMYGYYALAGISAATRKFRIPKFVNMIITSLQILQMVVGMVVQVAQIKYKLIDGDEACQTDKWFILNGSLMYGSYFVLFMNYFLKTYFKKQKTQ